MDCAGFDSYRTLIRPSFKVAYKLVSALEWRCCPGFAGEECRKGEPSHSVQLKTAVAELKCRLCTYVPFQQFRPHLRLFF